MLHTPAMTQSSATPQTLPSLAGKVAIVTGSTSGIGLGIAAALATNGADLVINGFGDMDDIAKSQMMLESYGAKTAYSPADMSKPDQIMAMVDLARKTFGKVDILVINAGIQHVSPIQDFAPEKWNASTCFLLSGDG